MRAMITQQRLKELLDYDPETGIFKWRVNRDRAGNAKAGDIAGRINRDGHRRIKVDNRHYFAHRLAFLYMTGEWPKDCVDHIDGKPDHNAWANLREATPSENQRNARLSPRNQLGIRGVRKFNGKYRACITIDGETIHLGTFNTAAEAAAVRAIAARDLHGEFARFD